MVATTVLGSGVIAAAVTQGITTLREHTKRVADGRMAALIAALTLERYGSACADFVTDTYHHHYSSSSAGEIHHKTPTLPPWRTNIDLNLLPLHVASKLLDFEVYIEEANANLNEEFATDHFLLAMPVFIDLGEASFELAKEVRQQMGLPHRQTHDLDQNLKCPAKQRPAPQHNVGQPSSRPATTVPTNHRRLVEHRCVISGPAAISTLRRQRIAQDDAILYLSGRSDQMALNVIEHIRTRQDKLADWIDENPAVYWSIVVTLAFFATTWTTTVALSEVHGLSFPAKLGYLVSIVTFVVLTPATQIRRILKMQSGAKKRKQKKHRRAS
jgi:uncharacterized integral membrane protein